MKIMPEKKAQARNRYEVLIPTIFRNHYRRGLSDFEFDRSELETVAGQHGVKLPKNQGDLIYAFRYRIALPDEIVATGTSWPPRSPTVLRRSSAPTLLATNKPFSPGSGTTVWLTSSWASPRIRCRTTCELR